MLKIGDYTYGRPKVAGNISDVTIGKFCSIADGVWINAGMDHNVKNVSTYPFCSPRIPTVGNGPVKFDECRGIGGHPISKGPVVIGNDVWIGQNAMIMSGVSIGDGAVVAAGAVVIEDIPPYALCAGNPGAVRKKRFPDGVVERLLEIRWWDWDISEIRKASPLLASEDMEKFLEYAGSRGERSAK